MIRTAACALLAAFLLAGCGEKKEEQAAQEQAAPAASTTNATATTAGRDRRQDRQLRRGRAEGLDPDRQPGQGRPADRRGLAARPDLVERRHAGSDQGRHGILPRRRDRLSRRLRQARGHQCRLGSAGNRPDLRLRSRRCRKSRSPTSARRWSISRCRISAPISACWTRSDKAVDDKTIKEVTVGVQQATTGASFATDTLKLTKVQVYPDQGDMFTALRAGQIDAAITDTSIVLGEEVRGEGKVKVPGQYKTGEILRCALSEGRREQRDDRQDHPGDHRRWHHQEAGREVPGGGLGQGPGRGSLLEPISGDVLSRSRQWPRPGNLLQLEIVTEIHPDVTLCRNGAPARLETRQSADGLSLASALFAALCVLAAFGATVLVRSALVHLEAYSSAWEIPLIATIAVAAVLFWPALRALRLSRKARVFRDAGDPVHARIDTAAAKESAVLRLRLGHLLPDRHRHGLLRALEQRRGRQDLLLPAADAGEVAAGGEGVLEQRLHLRRRRDPGADLGADRRHPAAAARAGRPADPGAGHHLLRRVPGAAGHRDALSGRLRPAALGPAADDHPADRRPVRQRSGGCGGIREDSAHLVLHPGADPDLRRLCGRGLSLGHREHPLEPGRGRALARPLLSADHALS